MEKYVRKNNKEIKVNDVVYFNKKGWNKVLSITEEKVKNCECLVFHLEDGNTFNSFKKAIRSYKIKN